MGINMDIRNEPEYAFLDLEDLDDTEKNEIRAILRPHTGADSFKLPWDIGEKEYELNSEVVEEQPEDANNQWQHYSGIAESGMGGYEPCQMTTPSMITRLGHPYTGPMILVSEMTAMGNPYGNSAAGEPSSYPFVPQHPWAPSSATYSSGPELMSQPPSRENDRRGGGRSRGGGHGNSKRDSYNRSTNMNNDVQTRYVMQPQHQYSPMVPMYPVPSQQHPAAGQPIYLQPQASGFPLQAPQMYRNSSHSSYGHHPSGYPTESHMTNPNKYVKGSQGEATYYNQESQKSTSQKHHEARLLQRENCPTSVPPFRQGSGNSNEAQTARKTHGKALIVNNTSSNADARNNNAQNNTAKHSDNNKKVAFTTNHTKSEPTDASVFGNDRSEITLDKKEAPVVVAPAAVDNGTATAGDVIKEKTIREKEVVVSRPVEKVTPAPSQTEIPSPPKASAKVAENVEQHEPKNTQVELFAAKIPETPTVTLPTSTTSSASIAPVPAPSIVSFATVLKKGGSPMDSMRSTPPITKLPVGRVTAVSLPPPPPVETVPSPKTPSQDAARNETTGSTSNRNSIEPTTKPPEVSAWADTKPPPETSQQNNLNDPVVFRMAELLVKYQMDKQTVSLLPRGLTNRSNYCYINSILQALLACPPFYNLLMALPYRRNTTKNSSTPLIDNMTRFVREFNPLTEGARVPRKDKSQKRGEETAADVQCGAAFEPSYVYTMLKNTSCAGVFSVEGRQEDAEEFLSCLLNGISDEMLEVMKLVNTESNDSASDEGEPNVNLNNVEEEWKVMGPKNKGSITRCTEFGRTPLSDIFRGQLRSRVSRTGGDATDNVQPFFTLQLDIEKAESVDEALETLVGRDQVEGMTCSKTKQQIEAWKQVTLEELPVILILHLKWFDYKMDGCSKIFKRVGFPIDLKLDIKLLSPNVAKKLQKVPRQKQYKLFAVTYHDGKEASKGHYVTDAFHVGYGSWVRYDDSSVKGIYETDVLNPSPPRVPYLLYYRRCDTIGNNQPNTPRIR